MRHTIQLKDRIEILVSGSISARTDFVEVSKWWESDPFGFVCFEYEGLRFSIPLSNVLCISTELTP